MPDRRLRDRRRLGSSQHFFVNAKIMGENAAIHVG